MKSFIDKIHAFPINGEGMDLLIISCSNIEMAQFWESHLNKMRGKILKKSARVIAVVEDWQDGAGNAFGTLYALKKAKERLGTLDGSVAIYHTAGKGTRLAPLTLAEYNNKPAVKLPAILKDDPSMEPLSILEMVIRQTAPFAPIMKDRIAVFWSDQLFIPSEPFITTPTTPVELFAKKIFLPTTQAFSEKSLHQYGLATLSGQLLGKVSYDQFNHLSTKVDLSLGLAISMGSFSLSKEFAETLLNIYADELSSKKGKLDTDNHLWMPASLSKEIFLTLNPHLAAQWEKTRSFMDPSLFSVRDIGEHSHWWDFGTLSNYYKNCMKLLDATPEGEDLRLLFGFSESENITLGSSTQGSRIQKSILINTRANQASLNQVIAINSTINQAEASQGMFYNVSSSQPDSFPTKTVRADLKDHLSQTNLSFYSDLDQGIGWEEISSNNPCSFSQQYENNVKI